MEELKQTTVTGKADGPKILFTPAFAFQWMQPPTQQTGVRLGKVNKIPKAGEKFMEAAFHEFDKVGEVGVLVNADATVFFIGKLLDRQYGQGNS